MQGSQSKPCWSRDFCLQVTRCRAGLGLDEPCQVQCLRGAQAQWLGNPFYTLTSLTIKINHSSVWNPTLRQLSGERVLQRTDKSFLSLACQTVSEASFSLRRQQWLVLSVFHTTESLSCQLNLHTLTEPLSLPSPPHSCYWAAQISHRHRAHTSFQSTCLLQANPLFPRSNTPLLFDQTGLNAV